MKLVFKITVSENEDKKENKPPIRYFFRKIPIQ